MSTKIKNFGIQWLLVLVLTAASIAAPVVLDQVAGAGLTPAAYACPNQGGGGDC